MPFLSAKCTRGWYHVNLNWVVIEPVDTHYQPLPPGVWSHTVLISNLANRVQPILCYDLGDSILVRPGPCPCGSPLPAIRVQGRTADVLTFPTEGGKQVSIAPLAFATLVDQTPGIELFQIVQTALTNLRVRLKTATGSDPDRVWLGTFSGASIALQRQLSRRVATGSESGKSGMRKPNLFP